MINVELFGRTANNIGVNVVDPKLKAKVASPMSILRNRALEEHKYIPKNSKAFCFNEDP